MRLLGVKFDRYRRLAEGSMRLEGRLTAIVGPNEAGKTSFLRALEHFNHTNRFHHREDRSRGTEPFEEDHPVLSAWFALDDDDSEALRHIPAAKTAKRFILTKLADGTLEGSIDPPLRRDHAERKAVAAALTSVAARRWMDENEPLRTEITELAPELDDGMKLWSSQKRKAVRSVSSQLGAVGKRETQRLATRIDRLVTAEEQQHPNDAAAAALIPRRPYMAWFSEDVRLLQSEYDLNDGTPPALVLLASLAGIDLDQVRAAVADGDYPAAENLVIGANDNLEAVFAEAWKRSALRVRFKLDELVLRILVSNEAGEYTSIAERSDGLKTFVALVAFLRTVGDRPVILLIDEAEAHLHYDAQADLVRVLTRQPIAQKVIYTTHSAGCLPEDLGLGVRAIEPRGPDRSKIRNFIWDSGAGYSPLIFAMGATVTAITPTRQAVIAEGVSDAVLLPALLREATGREELGYQLAPGLANVDPQAALQLDLEAPRVAYLVDGDPAGRAKRKQLLRVGVTASRVVALGGVGSGLCVEDLLIASVYLDALNKELETWSHPPFPASRLPTSGRATAVAKWCKGRGFEAPSKINVAAGVLANAMDEQPIVSPNRRSTLRSTHSNIVSALVPPPASTQ